MSWKWIPAQLDQYIGSEIRNYSNVPDTLFMDQEWVPGYYLGEQYTQDYPFVLTHIHPNTQPIASSNGWVVSTYPFWCYQFMLYDENGNELLNEPGVFTPILGVDVTGQTEQDSQQLANSYQTLYGGKPVWWGTYPEGYSLTRTLAMYFSTTEQKFIIYRYTDFGNGYNNLHEPVYSPNTLSGGNTGEYFWKMADGADSDYLDPTKGPWDFNLTGGVDSYEGIDGTKIAKITVSLKADQFYTYSSPASVRSQETPPAGEYTNPVTGDKKLVGLASFKGNDNSLWTMNNYGLTSEYWVSEQHGGIDNALFHPNGENNWFSYNRYASGHKPYYKCDTDLSSLYGQSSLTLEYYEWNEGLSANEHIAQNDIQLTPGPMQLVKKDATILMGELAIWR